jgi:hypothetical protein
MDSDLYLHVLSSWEVIAASLFMMLFLPLVFYVASTKTRRKNTPLPLKPRKPKPAKPKPEKNPATEADEQPEEPGDRPRRRTIEPPEDAEKK